VVGTTPLKKLLGLRFAADGTAASYATNLIRDRPPCVGFFEQESYHEALVIFPRRSTSVPGCNTPITHYARRPADGGA